MSEHYSQSDWYVRRTGKRMFIYNKEHTHIAIFTAADSTEIVEIRVYVTDPATQQLTTTI